MNFFFNLKCISNLYWKFRVSTELKPNQTKRKLNADDPLIWGYRSHSRQIVSEVSEEPRTHVYRFEKTAKDSISQNISEKVKLKVP